MAIIGVKNLTYRLGGIENQGDLFYGENLPPVPSDLGAVIVGLAQGQALVSGSITPTGFLQPASGELLGSIQALQSATDDLNGYYSSLQSDSSSLGSFVKPKGVASGDLSSFIRPSLTSSWDLTSIVDPIAPFPLSGTILGVTYVDLVGEVYPIPGVSLNAQISGQPTLDLISSIYGINAADIDATYEGVFSSHLGGFINVLTNTSGILLSEVTSVLGVEVPEDLLGYITSNSNSQEILGSEISGSFKQDLQAEILGSPFPEDLDATISGVLFSGALQASVYSTGSLLDISGYVNSSSNDQSDLTGQIDGYGALDITAQINDGTQLSLSGIITAVPISESELKASILTISEESLSAQYIPVTASTLGSTVSAFRGATLNAEIVPKVFYIESSIDINTYAVDNLTALINSDLCPNEGNGFTDLQVLISGSVVGDLQASIIGVKGQYAVTTDILPMNLRRTSIAENLMFFVVEQPAIAEDKLPVILINSPISDLGAFILGTPQYGDLSAEIESVYVPSITKSSATLGEWVNPDTGEIKTIKLFFRGDVNNFYYSSSGGVTFPENTGDYLEMVVETYDPLDTETATLLTLKENVRRCVVNNLHEFPSIDEAIKYAIVCAAGELSGNLSATIFPIGEVSDITASISGIDSNLVSDLDAKIVAVTNQPILDASISGSGGHLNLTSIVSPKQAVLTASPFFDELGDRFMPTLNVLPNGDYEVILTSIPVSGSITVNNPDLYATISGLDELDLDATISGS